MEKLKVKITLIGGGLDGHQKVIDVPENGRIMQFYRYVDKNSHNIKLSEVGMVIEEYECREWITPKDIKYYVAFCIS